MSMTATTDSKEPTPIDDVDVEVRGEAIEKLICDVLDLEHTEPDPDEPDVFDARFIRPGHVLDRRPVEIKSCLPRIGVGSSSRSGRFWIRKASHDELSSRNGVYVFTVVDPDSTIENPAVLDNAVVPATRSFTEWLTWSPCNPGHRAKYAAQFRHAELFPNLNHD